MVSTSYLYEKAMDSGAGVRAYLMDAAVQQNWSESLLAYSTLAHSGPMVREVFVCDEKKKRMY
jgi:hypothetical protein